MVWLSRRPGSAERGNQRRFFRQSLELPIAVSVDGLPTAVYATLLNISETGCRVRSLILLDRKRTIQFELKLPGRNSIALKGRIVARSSPSNGAGFEYGLSFDELSNAQRDVLAREVVEIQRREAANRAGARDRAATAAPSSPPVKQRRRSVRTLVSFPVRYRLASRSSVAAQACDISAGGLRLLCAELLAPGARVEVRFRLPSDVLEIYALAEDRVEISPFGDQRNVRVPNLRRPFDEMVAEGKVVSRFRPARGRDVYGIQFIDLDGYQREEIARFTHATQLAKIAATKSTQQ